MLTKLLLGCLIAASAFAGDWLTFGHDPQRTGWAFEETRLSPDNVSKLTLSWKTTLKNEPFVLWPHHLDVAAKRDGSCQRSDLHDGQENRNLRANSPVWGC